MKAEDIVQLGTQVKGETKTSVWTIQMRKRQMGKKQQKEPPTLDVSVEDIIEVAMAPGEPWLVLDIKGWPEKSEPK